MILANFPGNSYCFSVLIVENTYQAIKPVSKSFREFTVRVEVLHHRQEVLCIETITA